MARPSLFSAAKQRMKIRRDAGELRPEELIKLRELLNRPAVDNYADSADVAARLGLSKRTILDWANAGEFDGAWGVAWKPAPNRLRIPLKGVEAFIASRRAASFFSGANAGTEEVSG